MVRRIFLAASLLACSGSLAAQEQVPVEVDAAWQHPHLDLAFPASLAGFTRTDVVRYDDDLYDVAATLEDRANATTATVYIYRAGIPDVAIWADRAATSMFASDRLGTFDLEGTRFGAFTPPDASGVDSGFRLVAPVSGRGFKTTGLAIFPHDDWLIKVRMTSAQLDVDALQARIGGLVDALPLGPAEAPARAFATIEDCPSPLAIKKDAKLIRLDMAAAMTLGAVFGTASKDVQAALDDLSGDEGKSSSGITRWCRDRLGENFAVYRPDAGEKSFTIAFGDAGVTASVDAFDMASLMKPSKGYLVRVSNGVTEDILPPFDRLPKPEQVVDAVGRIGPITTLDVRPGGNGDQTIYVPSD